MSEPAVIADDAVPPGEVWVVQSVRRRLLQEWDAAAGVWRVRVVTTYERIGSIVNLAP